MQVDILVVDDEPAIRRMLCGALGRAGLTFVEAGTAAEALRAAGRSPSPDLCLLDLGLPDRDGCEIIPQLAAAGIGVIVLTARDATDEKVTALDLGADDFVTKPFDTEELLARVRSGLRRAQGARAHPEIRSTGEIEIDRARHQVTVRGEQVSLTPREFALLWTLADQPGRVLTHAWLLENVWGVAQREDIDYLRVAIRSLRKKVEQTSSRPRLIINEPGVGYRLAG